MKFSSVAVLLAALATVLAGGAGLGMAGSTYSGTLAGYTQGAVTGAPTETASHFHSVGGDCTETITFSYNGIMGDTFGETGLEGAFVTSGKDYVTHFYLFVFDGAGNQIDGGAFIEDDGWESGSLVGATGALPVMEATATLSGACGDWEFFVDAHRGAGEYTITVE